MSARRPPAEPPRAAGQTAAPAALPLPENPYRRFFTRPRRLEELIPAPPAPAPAEAPPAGLPKNGR